MKMVIANYYYFYLDYETIIRYFELKGLGKPYFYNSYCDNIVDGKLVHQYKKISDEELDMLDIDEIKNWSYITSVDKGDICDEIFDDYFFDVYNMNRQDEILIQVVEELKPTNLKVVEIPDDIKWYIDSPDGGCESIHEEHRIWN